MSGRNQKIGAWGESVATEYLEKRGFIIIGRNVRTPYGEIDIVVEKDGVAIFVEVKTRTSKSLGPPEIAVTPRKQEHYAGCGRALCSGARFRSLADSCPCSRRETWQHTNLYTL